MADGEVNGVGQMGEIEVGGTKEDWPAQLWSGTNMEDVSMATTVALNKQRQRVVVLSLPD